MRAEKISRKIGRMTRRRRVNKQWVRGTEVECRRLPVDTICSVCGKPVFRGNADVLEGHGRNVLLVEIEPGHEDCSIYEKRLSMD